MSLRRSYMAVAGPFGRDLDACMARIERGLADARAAGAALIVFPECALGGPPGHPGRSAHPIPPRLVLDGPELEHVASQAGDMVVCLGISEAAGRHTYSTAVCLTGDGILGVHRKVHIPPAELETYTAGDRFVPIETPIGRLGIVNCYDKLFPEAARSLALQGAETIAALSAWPLTRDDAAPPLAGDVQSLHFDLMDQTRAVENQVMWVSSNQSGTVEGYRYMGQAKIVGPDGTILAGTSPGELGTAIATAEGPSLVAAARDAISYLRDRRPAAYDTRPVEDTAPAPAGALEPAPPGAPERPHDGGAPAPSAPRGEPDVPGIPGAPDLPGAPGATKGGFGAPGIAT